MKNKLVLKVKKLNKAAKLPEKNNPEDAGFDLSCINKESIPSNTIKVLSTGLAIEIPKGYYGQISERSGFSTRNTLKLKAGVIDSGYRGEVGIVVQNCGDYPIIVDAFTKVAQLVLLPVPTFTIEEVTNLSETARGEQGFGSSDTIGTQS